MRTTAMPLLMVREALCWGPAGATRSEWAHDGFGAALDQAPGLLSRGPISASIEPGAQHGRHGNALVMMALASLCLTVCRSCTATSARGSGGGTGAPASAAGRPPRRRGFRRAILAGSAGSLVEPIGEAEMGPKMRQKSGWGVSSDDGGGGVSGGLRGQCQRWIYVGANGGRQSASAKPLPRARTNWQLQRVDQFYNGPSIMGLFRPTMMVRALGATNYHRHDADAVAWPCK